MQSTVKLKREILKLLKEDEEFRYMVAGSLGLEEILKRLDKHEEILIEHSKELSKLREDFNRLLEEQKRLREDLNKGFVRHDEILNRHAEELVRFREDLNKGFARYDMELIKLREEMVKSFVKHDEILTKHSEEIIKLREEMNKGFTRYDAELTKLREDMNRGFQLLERLISALGARWDLLGEAAFREGLKGLLEKEFKFKIERGVNFDNEGYVYGFPSQ